jgi:hypothetical protein
MDRQSWNCALCQIPNSSALTECRNCKTPRTVTSEKLAERHAVVGSRIVYAFQAIILLFAVFQAKTITSSPVVGAAIVIGVWWAGLACFASQTFGDAFLRERRYICQLDEVQAPMPGRKAIRLLLYSLYWPIFISKNAYFVFILGVGVVYYGAKYLHD